MFSSMLWCLSSISSWQSESKMQKNVQFMEAVLCATKNVKINVFKKNKTKILIALFFTFLDHCGVAMWHNLLPEWFWPSILAKCHSRNFQKGERYNKFSKEEAEGSKHYYTISDKKHSHKIEFPLTNSEKNNTAILCSTICMFSFFNCISIMIYFWRGPLFASKTNSKMSIQKIFYFFLFRIDIII